MTNIYPSGDAFITQLQERGLVHVHMTTNMVDQAVDEIHNLADSAGIVVAIYLSPAPHHGSLNVIAQSSPSTRARTGARGSE